MAIVNAEDLRRSVIDHIDEALDAPIASRWLSGETKRMMRAVREYWRAAGATEAQALFSQYSRTGGEEDET